MQSSSSSLSSLSPSSFFIAKVTTLSRVTHNVFPVGSVTSSANPLSQTTQKLYTIFSRWRYVPILSLSLSLLYLSLAYLYLYMYTNVYNSNKPNIEEDHDIRKKNLRNDDAFPPHLFFFKLTRTTTTTTTDDCESQTFSDISYGKECLCKTKMGAGVQRYLFFPRNRRPQTKLHTRFTRISHVCR